MFGLLKPAAEAPRLPAERVDPEYRRLRRQVFAGIFAGYAAYYLVRNTLALAIPDLLKEYPQYSKAMLGTALTGLSIAYGLSKFLMGSVSDRSNPKYFLPLGLLLSAGIIFVSGTVKAIYASLCAGRGAADPERLGPGHGLAAVRQEHGALVEHAGARPHRGDVERGAQRGRRAGRQLRARRRDAVPRLGREVLFQRPDRGSDRRRRVLPAAGHPAVVRPAAGRGVQERLPARLQRGPRAHPHVPGDLLPPRPEQQIPVGDRGGQRLRLLRPLRGGELDPDLSGDRQGLLVPAVERGLGALRVRGIPGTIACG